MQFLAQIPQTRWHALLSVSCQRVRDAGVAFAGEEKSNLPSIGQAFRYLRTSPLSMDLPSLTNLTCPKASLAQATPIQVRQTPQAVLSPQKSPLTAPVALLWTPFHLPVSFP